MSSRSVRIGMVGALSLTVAACGSNDNVTAYCVDRSSYRSDGSYSVVNDRYCDNGVYGSSHGGYYWYYGGRRSGSRILSGTTVKPKDATITSHSGKTIQRGGFGGHSSSHSGS
jgi:uncharacterized protein YgiB involved in biofilm formation